ncbi:hypothetical protein BDF20DRAFT_803616, partial [Mycotypha africana]|uniref:uncharacterized protein n=1 Tax=Mycotypha africana TaxID=64632 RepID=UPI002300822B
FGKGTDFDLAVYNAQTDEEYKDDMFVVPRNTSVIVRRLPAARPGKGTAQRYVQGVMDGKSAGKPNAAASIAPPGSSTGTNAVHRGRNLVLDAQKQRQQQMQKPSPSISNATTADANAEDVAMDSEEARIQAMFQQETSQWDAMQEKLAEQQYIPYNNRGDSRRGGRGGFQGSSGHRDGGNMNENNKDGQQPIRVPPPTYVCYRCGQKGHYINQCPTNGDKDYDKHPRIKKTTGIPRSFLKVIEEPKDAVKAGTGGLMVTPKGDIVVAQADSSTWDKHVAKTATTIGLGTAGDLMDWYDSIPVIDYLQCPICHGLLKEASITPCCGMSFCDECIRGHLMDHDFACHECKKPIQNGLDGLIPNLDLRECVENYVRRFVHN